MNGLLLVAVGLGAVALGAAAFAGLAETQLGGEASALGARLGFSPQAGSTGKIFALIDAVSPGESDVIKTKAVMVALGGAAVGVLAYAVAREALA